MWTFLLHSDRLHVKAHRIFQNACSLARFMCCLIELSSRLYFKVSMAILIPVKCSKPWRVLSIVESLFSNSLFDTFAYHRWESCTFDCSLLRLSPLSSVENGVVVFFDAEHVLENIEPFVRRLENWKMHCCGTKFVALERFVDPHIVRQFFKW